MNVRVLAPDGAEDLAAFLRDVDAYEGTPFSDARVAALSAISEGFLHDPLLRRDPACVAAAYWIRRSSLARLKASYERRCAAEPGVVRVPVGRVFHVAPSNVDTLFVYSWALSFLCGNANVVRVSSEQPPAALAMLRVIATCARDHAELRLGDRFVTYAHDAAVTQALSDWCTHRVLWGGDETIAALRPLPLPSHASERVFGTKFSYAVIAAAPYASADAEARGKLAAAFFNDMFWFDQMACSSPHIVFWVGNADDTDRAAATFADTLEAEAQRRGYWPAASTAVRRLVHAFGLAADADVRVDLARPTFVDVRVRDAGGLVRDTCGGGLIRHARLERLDDLATFAGDADQTVTHWGFTREELVALATRAGRRGVDRIVPVGEALAFGVVWDGHDLVEDFVRKVAVEAP